MTIPEQLDAPAFLKICNGCGRLWSQLPVAPMLSGPSIHCVSGNVGTCGDGFVFVPNPEVYSRDPQIPILVKLVENLSDAVTRLEGLVTADYSDAINRLETFLQDIQKTKR